jgi:hypothetical protein
LGDGAAVFQALHANQFDARELERGLVALDVGGCAIVFRLVGPRIDDEQEVAALDLAAFGECQLVDVARNPRADFHRLHGLQPSGELIPILDPLLQYLGHADLRRRLGAPARLAAPADQQQRADGDRGHACSENSCHRGLPRSDATPLMRFHHKTGVDCAHIRLN